MGYELDRMMQQYGFSTPVLSYSGMSMPIKPGDIATGASAMEKANYDALLAKYNADMPLYTSDQAKYKTYSDEYNNRLANTSMYNAPQFQTGAMSSPGTGAFTDQYSQMYQDVLGRAPDATGLAYWKGKFGDMISPEEYAQFRQSAAAEIGGRPINTLPVTTPRAILNQPTYSTPTAAPVLQTAAKTTNPYVLPVDVGGGGGNDGGGSGGGSGGQGQTGWGTVANLAGEAQRAGFTTIGGFLGGLVPVGAEYNKTNLTTGLPEKGNFTTADKAALGDKAAIAAMTAQNQSVVQDTEGGSSGNDGGGGARAGGEQGATGGGYQAKGGYIGSYAHGGTISTKKVRRFDEGGGVGEGFGYGEGAGAAQGSGMGGYGSEGEGYGDSDPRSDSISNSTTMSTTANTPMFDSVTLNQANYPVVSNAYNNALATKSLDQNQNLSSNFYGYQDAQQARDAFDSFAAEQSMRNEGADGRAKGGYIGHYAHGGAVRHYQAGGDVMSKMAEADLLIKALEGGKLTENEREDAMSRVAEIYRMLDEEPAQAAPTPIPESLLALQVTPESQMVQQVAPMPSGGDLIQPMPESVPVTPRQIRQAIADASPLTALKETVNNKPVAVEGAPLVRPLDPRLYGETDDVATGKGYSPMDPRLYGETNEVASGPGYSMPVVTQRPPPVDQKLLDLAAKYTKPGFTPTFAQGSIDPGANRMALISQNAIANKIANPVVNIQPEYADDSASRLSMPMPQDTTIPMSPTMAMLQKMLLASQSQASPYADELRTARAAATAQTAAFNKMLENAIKGQDDNKPSKAEMYFRLAAAFGAPTKTGHFAESLAEVNKSMAEQAKETRLAGKAGQALRLQLGLEGAKANMTAAREDVTALRGLTSEEMKEKAAIQRELIKEYFKSGEAQSTAGKQAQDEGLIPGTAKFQARVTAISEEQFKRLTAGVDASLAAAQASLASIEAGRETRRLAQEKFDAAQAKTKADAAKLSPAEIKMKEETSQALVTMRDAYADLVKALQLSANAYDGSLADQALYKPLAAAGNQDPKVVNTGVLDNLLKLGALSTAATTLKTQISDSDMKMLNQVQGAGAKSRQERDAILKAAMVRMENMYQEKKSKLAEIVSGKYRIATPAIAEEAE